MITPRDTALLTSYVVTERRPVRASAARATARSRTRSSRRSTSPAARSCWSGTASITYRSRSPTRRSKRTGTSFTSTRSTSTATATCSSPRAARTPSTSSTARGAIVWRLGGKHSDFEMGAGSNFAWQHDARRQPDGTLTVFDNGATPAVEQLSRGLILDVDEQAMTATLVRQYTHPRILAGSQGSVQLLANGNVFVGWGEAPRVIRVPPLGSDAVRCACSASSTSLTERFACPGPAFPPRLRRSPTAGGGDDPTVYASWNGATDVHRWQLLAGTHTNDLQAVASARSARVRERASRRDGRPLLRRAGAQRRRGASRALADGERLGLSASEQQPLQPDHGRLLELADPAYRQQHARHERLAPGRVVTDRERLTDVAEDHLLVGDEPGQAHRVDRRRSGTPPAAAISSAVRFAVPLGASSLASWCSSTISALAMCPAASAAKRIIRTAPIAKFGAISTFAVAAGPPARAPSSAARRRSRSCRSPRALPPAHRRARSPAPCPGA